MPEHLHRRLRTRGGSAARTRRAPGCSSRWCCSSRGCGGSSRWPCSRCTSRTGASRAAGGARSRSGCLPSRWSRPRSGPSRRASFLDPNPTFPHTLGTLPEWTTAPLYASSFVFLGLLVAAAVALVRRRRASHEGPLIGGCALAGMWLPVTLLLCFVSFLIPRGPDLVVIGLALTYLSVPAATAVAILRHDLYDVDRAFGATRRPTALVTGRCWPCTGRGRSPAAWCRPRLPPSPPRRRRCARSALAPLRARLQRRVDRRLYPARRAALAAVDELRDRAPRRPGAARAAGGGCCAGAARPAACGSATAARHRRARRRGGRTARPAARSRCRCCGDGAEVGVLVRGDRGPA